MERSTVSIECLAQEHNAMSLARAQNPECNNSNNNKKIIQRVLVSMKTD